jgi:FixJ family two-component response regulator
MRDEELRSLRARFARLTAREREVFGHVTHGRLNKQIADELRTSVRTVKAHRAQVMSKMEVASLADLVSAAARLGSAADS